MKADSLKVAIESELVIKTNELIDENIRLKKANEYLISQKDKLQAIFDYYGKWHTGNERPEKDGYYLCKLDTNGEPTVFSYKHGVWSFWDYYYDTEVFVDMPKYWLPIPPEGY